MAITLVPDTLAKPGLRFTFNGPNLGSECQGCPVQKLCFGLAPGHAYEVTNLREASHPCALHDGGRVRAVDVVPTSFASTVETRLLRGTAATWAPLACGRPECANYGLCHPVGPKSGARHAITQQDGALECPAGFELTKVRLQAM